MKYNPSLTFEDFDLQILGTRSASKIEMVLSPREVGDTRTTANAILYSHEVRDELSPELKLQALWKSNTSIFFF